MVLINTVDALDPFGVVLCCVAWRGVVAESRRGIGRGDDIDKSMETTLWVPQNHRPRKKKEGMRTTF